MKKISVLLFIILTSCNPEPVAVNCNCFKFIYKEHQGHPKQFLFKEKASQENCDSWNLGDDTKTDANGYVFNFKEVCE
jgi:hypothetical protein